MVLDKDTFERLKQNDPSVTHLHTHLDCRSGIENPNRSDDIFNSIDWGKDGYCISNNTQIEKIEIYILRNTIISSNGITNQVRRYVLGQEGQNLPTKQQQDFFALVSECFGALFVASGFTVLFVFAITLTISYCLNTKCDNQESIGVVLGRKSNVSLS